MFARHLASCGFGLKQQLQEARMDHATLRAAIVDYFRTQLDEAKARRASLGPFTPEERQQVENGIDLLEEDNADYWRLLGRENAETELGRFFQVSGLSRDEYWPHAMRVLDEIRKGKIGAAKEIMAFAGELDAYDFSGAQSAAAGAAGAVFGREPATSPEPSHRVAQAISGPLLSELFAQRKVEAEKSNEWSPKLREDYQSWTELFIEVIGDRPILEYKKPDARKFKDILMQLPSNRGKHAQTKGLSPLEAIEVAKTHGLDTLSPSTVNKGLARMQATWNWADKQLDEEVTDIFGPMKLAGNGNARAEADPFPGYWNNPEQSKELFVGDHLRLGDLGRVDDFGYLYLSDRVKFRMKSGGYNVYPTEIENVLADHDAVSEVCVFGVPDSRWGDRIEAVVTLREGAECSGDALKDFCRNKIANFKIPKNIEIWDDLPRGATGKILKRSVIDLMVERYAKLEASE